MLERVCGSEIRKVGTAYGRMRALRLPKIAMTSRPNLHQTGKIYLPNAQFSNGVNECYILRSSPRLWSGSTFD